MLLRFTHEFFVSAFLDWYMKNTKLMDIVGLQRSSGLIMDLRLVITMHISVFVI